MNYKQACRLYTHRKPGAQYKIVNQNLSLRVFEETGEAIFYERHWKWEDRKRKETEPTPFAVIDRDNIFRPLSIPHGSSVSMKNAVNVILGFGCAQSMKHSGFAETLRFLTGNVNVPYNRHLRVDTGAHKVVSALVSEKLVSNRKKTKPAYDYADRVIDLMTVMYRVGAYAGDTKHVPYNALSTHINKTTVDELFSEERIPDLAEVLFKHTSKFALNLARPSHWDDVAKDWVYDPDFANKFIASVRTAARRTLVAQLKRRAGLLDTVEVTA